MTLDFWRIAMRPGKPLIFGRLGEAFVLGFRAIRWLPMFAR